ADEMKAVVVPVDAVVDVNSVDVNVAALDDADRMVGACDQPDVANDDVLTLMQQHVVRTVVPSPTGGRRNAPARAGTRQSLAVNGSGTVDSNVFRSHGENQPDIAVAQSGIALQGNRARGAVLRSVGAA